MKIKSIAAICKKNKNIAIFERYSDDGDILTQYIGDGSAVYPVVGLPQLDNRRKRRNASLRNALLAAGKRQKPRGGGST